MPQYHNQQVWQFNAILDQLKTEESKLKEEDQTFIGRLNQLVELIETEYRLEPNDEPRIIRYVVRAFFVYYCQFLVILQIIPYNRYTSIK